MDRDHAIRCVMEAVAAGGRTCGNDRAAKLLRGVPRRRGKYPLCDQGRAYTSDLPDNGCYYIPYRHRWQTKEACVGPWVEIVRKEEQEIALEKRSFRFSGSISRNRRVEARR